jgi:hypothetical protein
MELTADLKMPRAVSWALLAWYLMTAPYSGPPSNRRIDPTQPLAEWHILAPYDSIAECEAKRHLLFEKPASSSNPQTIVCVSSEDSRIKLGGRLPQAGPAPVP